MRKILSLFVVLSIVLVLPISALAGSENEKTDRKIVVFKSGVDDLTKDILIKQNNGVKVRDSKYDKDLKVVSLSDRDAGDLANDPNILRVDNDILISINDKKNKKNKPVVPPAPPVQPTQILPWGIDKVDAELSWSKSTGSGVKVAVLDTGIDLTHPDLAANIKGGFNTINPASSANDDNGHGTHVAGIIGALNNSIGVVGVAPNVSLYAVKALDKNGSGYLSDVIEGLDWAIANNMNIVNMSLGTNYDIPSFYDAIARASNAGIVLVAAAGNDGGAVDYPAAYPGVMAVSATDSSDAVTYWSSRGPEISLAAPGLNILSTWKGGGYATVSGTSMSSPHVAGSAADLMASPVDPLYDANANGVWDASEVKSKLEAKATDLGAIGFDILYGFGLVNIFNAL
ncbi:S8 family peptidase [Candidatus Azambacteria bacterium]|nr:S8 family peptidase [Candidatus Azambacteria bacterium]